MQTCYEVITDFRWEIIKEIIGRNLPHYYPPWETVYYYFRKWKKYGTFECINSTLNKL